MSKPVIAVDIDDVLSSQVDVLIAFSNERYGTNLSHADFMIPGEYWGYYERVWGLGKDLGAERFQTFLREKYPLRQQIEEKAIRAITALKKSHRLDLVTSRGADYYEPTLEWLEKHAPGLFEGVHFVDLWAGETGLKTTKAKICKEIGAGYLIDDNAEHCNLAAEAGVSALLFGEFGWNLHHKLHPRVVRIADWEEVLEYFDARSRR